MGDVQISQSIQQPRQHLNGHPVPAGAHVWCCRSLKLLIFIKKKLAYHENDQSEATQRRSRQMQSQFTPLPRVLT